jgi:uncharacterized membrane protein
MTPPPALFEAVIRPYRSLSPRGLKILIGSILALSAGTSSVFWWLGAWPVAGFSGVEVGLVVFLLRRNVRFGRARELIVLTEGHFRILRTDPSGRQQERTLDPYWLRVVLRERPGRVPKLLLTSRSLEEEVGAQLGEEEKRDLAAALGAAMERWRNPVFDNEQLK